MIYPTRSDTSTNEGIHEEGETQSMLERSSAKRTP